MNTKGSGGSIFQMRFQFLDFAEWNRRLTRLLAPWQVFGLATLFALLIFALPSYRRGEWNHPPLPGDGPDYDAIAMSLAAGHGFSLIGNSPEYLEPYERTTDPVRYEYLQSRPSEPTLTAYRPPLLPMLMAGTYKVFGRQFGPTRAINCLLMAAAGGLMSLLVFRFAGAIPAGITAVLFGVFDERMREHARDLLTESLATFLVTLLVWMFVAYPRHRCWWAALTIGLVAGLAVLSRSAFIFWMPGFVTLVFVLSASREVSWFATPRWRAIGLCLLGFLLMTGPWFIRNCLVLEAFMPTGTQGYIALGSAYSDEIFETQGNWYPLPASFFANMKNQDQLQGLELEKQQSLYSKAQADLWMQNNPGRIPELVVMKLNRFWRAKNRFDVIILTCGSLGLLLSLSRLEGRVFLMMLLLCAAQVAATYEAFGRFQVPVAPILNGLAGLGIWAMILCASSYRTQALGWLEEGGYDAVLAARSST